MQPAKTFCLLVIGLMAFAAATRAQRFYANLPDAVREINVGAAGCTVTNLPIPCMTGFFSIAISGDTLYVLSGEGLFRTFLSNTAKCEKIMEMGVLNSLTVDKQGILYGAADGAIVKINPYTQSYDLLPMPFTPAGDMIFYKDKLYLAASNNNIVEIDIAEPMKSRNYIALTQFNVFGLTSISGTCSANKVFALAASGGSTELIELDMENRKVLGKRCTLQGEYFDAASSTENGGLGNLVIDRLETRNICFGSNQPSFIKITMPGNPGDYTYTLNSSISNRTGIFTGIQKGYYRIRVSTADSCVADTAASISEGFCNVWLPNAFTPNNDGLNDSFRPLGLTPSGKSLLCIYNRWGKKIFESADFQHGWNGRVNGDMQPAGTYIYTLTYMAEGNVPELRKGTLVLMR